MTTDNKTLADVQPGGMVRLGDGLPPLPPMEHIGRVVGNGPYDTWYEPVAYTAKQMLDYARAALAARQPVYVQGSDELRARTEGERAAYMEGLEEGKKIAARQPVGAQRAALWVQFAENGNMQFFTRDPDRAVEESFCYARPLTAYYEKPFPIEDLSRFKDLIGFAAWQAIQLPETDPRRDFIRQSGELIRIIDSAKEISK